MMRRPLKVAVQMDPIGVINIDGDSTFALMLEAQGRGHALWHYEVRTLSLFDGKVKPKGFSRFGRVIALCYPVTVERAPGKHFTLGSAAQTDLAEMDVILMRQDPPFNMAYVTATHILDHIHPQTLVVNDPRGVRDSPEKLLVTQFPDLMPPTLISRSVHDIREFQAQYGDIVVKPLYGNGGVGVFHIPPDDENLASLLEMHAAQSNEPLMVQRYEPAVRSGDKRIILIDGRPMGSINRVPAIGEARSNMHVGGRAEPAQLTDRDRTICERIGPTLREKGLLFAGIDVIGDWLTEINVTSPTGLQEIHRFGGLDLAKTIWDVIEGKRAST